MGLFNRGQAASALILDGKRAVRAYLGGQLVWDGTMDAFVSIPYILVSVAMADPVVSATARTVAPFITASALVRASSVSGTATVRPETAILVSGAVRAPIVSADSLVEGPAISVSAIVLAPTVSEAFDATVQAPFLQVSGGVYSPQITADYLASAPIIAAFVEVLAPLVTATGTAVVNAPMITVTGTMSGSVVRGSSAVAAPAIAATASVLAPELRRDAKVTTPIITATATAFVPNVQAINFQPQGMNLTTEFVFKTTTPVIVTPMVATTATMPTSVVDTNALDMQNPGPVRVAWTAPISNYSGDKMDGAVYVNGALVGTAVRTDNPPFRRGAVLFGSANATVAKNAKVALRVNGVNASFDQSVTPGARVNVYKQDQLSQIGSRSADYVVTSITNVWFDLMPNATSPGAVLNGTALVAQFDHPDVLLGADIYMSSANPVNLRILKNGVQVASGTAGSNDGRVGALGNAPVVVGDLIQVQVARPNAGNWTVKTGSSWGIV